MSIGQDSERKGLDFVVLGTDPKKDRIFVVVKGQAFYRSTGFNTSGYKLKLSPPPKEIKDKNVLYCQLIDNGLRPPFIRISLLSPYGTTEHIELLKLKGCNISDLVARQRVDEKLKAQCKILSKDNHEEAYKKHYEQSAEFQLQEFLPDILKELYLYGYTHSSAKHRWTPCVMVAGTKKPVSLEGLPEIYNNKIDFLKEVIEFYNKEDPAYIIKPGEFLKEDFKAKEGIKKNIHFNEFQAERIALKRFLITSSQLDVTHYSEQQLKDAGLTKEEIKLAKTPIWLAKEPALMTADGDEVNAWLAKQGASYIDDLLAPKKSVTTQVASSASSATQGSMVFFPQPRDSKQSSKVDKAPGSVGDLSATVVPLVTSTSTPSALLGLVRDRVE